MSGGFRRRKQWESGPGPLPPRWLHCPRKSNTPIGSKFIAFKTPLGSKFDGSVDEEYRFHPKMLFESLKSYKVKVGLWIDLTNTDRFYDRQEVEEMGCKYVKLNCRGHGECPSDETVQTFVSICKRFIQQNPLESIGVHCTHGFNRTGFLITAYLVTEEDWSVEAAVMEFARARPPGIYKQDYLEELFKKFGDVEDTPPAPALPSWHTESDDTQIGVDDDGNDLGNDAEEQGDEDGPSKKKRRKEKNKKCPVFMEGVPGVQPVTEPLLGEIQRKVQEICEWDSSGFPGCQPVSMDLENLECIKDSYMVSWKADGTRYMMYINGKDRIFFLDRDNSVFQVKGVTFLRGDLRTHLSDTLLDGEMVIDKVVEGNQTKHYPRYLIYDCIQYEGDSQIGKSGFQDRLRYIREKIIAPRTNAMKKQVIIREREPFGVRCKDFWDKSYAGYLLSEKFQRNLSHEPDGLIFQPVNESYVPGQCPSVLKWKPPSHNSVDFRLKIVTEDKPGCLKKKIGYLYVGSLDTPFASMRVTKDVKDMDKKIVECKFENNEWKFMRERTDKSFPNSYNTAMSVCQSIREPVTETILLDFIKAHSSQFKAPLPAHSSSSHRR